MERTDHKQTENEQTEVAAHTAEAESSNGAAATEVSLGKFKDVNSLLKAYENLESEFTRRSRRLRELEGEVLKQKEEITRRGASSSGEKGFRDGKPTTVGISENTGNIGENNAAYGGGSVEKGRAAEGENAARAFSADEKSTDGKLGDVKTSDTNESEKTSEGQTLAGDKKPENVSEGAPADEKTADEAEEIVQAYLLSVLKSRPSYSPALGKAVTAPPRKPRSFEEAGKMIKTDLDN